MYMYTCMYITCVGTGDMCVHMHTRIYVYTCVYTYIHTGDACVSCTHTHTRILNIVLHFVYVCICVYMCVYVCIVCICNVLGVGQVHDFLLHIHTYM